MSFKRIAWNRLMALLLVLGYAITLARPAAAKGLTSPLITGIRVSSSKQKVRVRVAATGPVQYRVLNLTDPHDMLVVEIFPAQLATSVPRAYPVRDGVVERVRAGQFSDEQNIVRVVVDLAGQARYQVGMAPGHRGLSLAVSTWEVAAAKLPKTDAGSVLSGASRIAPPSSVAAPAVRLAALPVKHYRYVAQRTVAARPKRRHHRATGFHRTASHMVSLDFVNADLVYVLKLLAKELNENLVTDSTVKGTVTLSLKDVSAQFAMNVVLKIAGFEDALVDHTLIVGSKETIDKIRANPPTGGPEAAVGKKLVLPIPLENAKAASVADTIKSVYPNVDVTVQADQNFVVVKGDSQQQLREIKEFVQKLDVPPPPPVVLKTEIVPIKYGKIESILALSKTLHPNLNYNVDDRLNALIVTGQDRDIDALKAFLATVDIPLQQVELDIKVVSLSEEGKKNLGFSVGSTTGTGVTFGTAGPITFTENFPASATTTGQLAISNFVRTGFLFGATMQLLISETDAKVIASPRMVTQSGEEASVLIGQKFPIVYFDPRAGQFQVQYVDIGVKLVAKPIVSSDGWVTINLSPEVSTLQGLVANQYPETNVTQLKTVVRVRDGDTFVLGGLLQELENSTVQKYPFLGDIPILGELFRNTTLDRAKSEVYLLLTPKIL